MKKLILLVVVMIGLNGCSSVPFKDQTGAQKTGTVVGYIVASPLILLNELGKAEQKNPSPTSTYRAVHCSSMTTYNYTSTTCY